MSHTVKSVTKRWKWQERKKKKLISVYVFSAKWWWIMIDQPPNYWANTTSYKPIPKHKLIQLGQKAILKTKRISFFVLCFAKQITASRRVKKEDYSRLNTANASQVISGMLYLFSCVLFWVSGKFSLVTIKQKIKKL